MKKIILVASILFSINAIAQSDSTNKKQDTIRVGNMLIVSNGSAKDIQSTKEKFAVGLIVEAKNKRNKGVKVWSSVPDLDGNMVILKKDTLVSINDDTIKVGRMKIINKSEDNPTYGQKNWESLLSGDFKKTKIIIEKSPRILKPITTNWWIFDLGFANLVDNTAPLMYYPNYSLPSQSMLPSGPNSTNLKLNNAKSSNVNIWIVQQKANLYNHYWNLKYGIGIEMYNFRFEQPISFSNTPGNYVFFDNVNFSKNKLFVEYLTVPIQLNYQSNPENNKSFYASLGLSAGYLLQSHTKQISEERGKRKMNGNFNLNNTKLATIGELGIGGIRLYGSYSLTNLFDKNLSSFDMAPFAIGVRFSRF